jgi:hypothetical protein
MYKNGIFNMMRKTLKSTGKIAFNKIEAAVTPPSRKLLGIIKPLSATTAIKTPETV